MAVDAWDAVVIGAGAAGLVAATQAAERGRRTLLVEKNRKAGVKILMSGGTRCNLTQSTDKWGIVRAYGDQGNFLHSALAVLGPADLVKMVEQEGVPTKVEETGKIFPVSNKALDILNALLARLKRSDAELALEEPVERIERDGDGFLVTTNKRALSTQSVLVTTGGRSYPGAGTTGDGYAWAAQFGHAIVPPRPALVPITTSAPWVQQLQGVTIPEVDVRVVVSDRATPEQRDGLLPRRKGKTPAHLAERKGSFLFTHFGLSGPAVLDVSRAVTGFPQPQLLDLVCDFLPAVSQEQLDQQLRDQCAAEGKKQLVGILSRWAPRRLAETLLTEMGLSLDVRGADFSKRDRARLVAAIKQARIPISGTRGFAKAEVTAGGVALNEVDSHTMQSKLAPGLFFAGEVLDLDGPIGGYNFQAAFSTGVLAGMYL
jgi:predicted Rossmann fold flavoprotein